MMKFDGAATLCQGGKYSGELYSKYFIELNTDKSTQYIAL